MLTAPSRRLWSWSYHEKEFFERLEAETNRWVGYQESYHYQLFTEEFMRKAKIFRVGIFFLSSICHDWTYFLS